MNKSLTLIAGALALSAGLAIQAAPSVALEGHKYDKLQDEFILMAQADYKHARNRYVKSHPSQEPSERRDQGSLTGQWRDYEHKRELRHADLGKFADLYRHPSLPAHAQYTHQEEVFGVDVKYSKATGAYNNSGILMDIAQASITDGDVRLQDALLASKLVAAPQVARHQNDNVINNAGAVVTSGAIVNGDGYLGYLADKKIIFNGQRERIEAGFNVARYFFEHLIGLGLFVPVVQDKRNLGLDLMSSIEDVTKTNAAFPDNLAAFNRRYGNSSQAFLADAFKAKGMNSFGGTSTGLGDVQLYAQAKISTKYLDRVLFNARVIIPTAPQATTDKLWAPERGNGGFYQAGLSFSAVGHYNRYFNPHYFVEGLCSLPAVVPQRVPVKMNIAAGTTSLQLGAATPLGYRLDPVGAGLSYNGFDVAFRNLGDTVSKLKLAKGLAFDMHIGNVFEQVFVRRGFLDVFYNFKIKARDRALGLPISDFNLEQYERNSEQLEHRLGGEWRWQVNQAATLRLGIEQVVRGKNIAQDTQVSAGINYGF